MSVEKIAGVAAVPKMETAGEVFGRALESAPRPASSMPPPLPVARGASAAAPGVSAVAPRKISGAVGSTPLQGQAGVAVAERVVLAQQRLDRILAMAQSGKTFTPAELLALQAQVYRASQELDLAGKVVEKVTGGVKQVLQTQV